MLRQIEWFLLVAGTFLGAGVLLAASDMVGAPALRSTLFLGSLALAGVAAVLMNVWAYLWTPGGSRTAGERRLGRFAHRLEGRTDRVGIAILWALAAGGVLLLGAASLESTTALAVGAVSLVAALAAFLLGDVLEAPTQRRGPGTHR